ncbi:FecCD family ABC transporter permease [Limnohabitans sp.]|uniref:FecCD family ABC transporter permease n=1 Tax=Limnohabitans sp. TaxID=1907725 RepID=UPI0035B3F6B8
MRTRPAPFWALVLLMLGGAGLVLGTAVGSQGWEVWWTAAQDPVMQQIVRDIRLPRSLGAWLGGALLGLAGAVAQGLFRNPLADPYLLGSASGASLGVSLYLSLFGGSILATAWLPRLGMTGAAFIGSVLAVVLTLTLARGVQQTLRLLLAGVVVGVVLGALASLVALFEPQVLQAMQGFMLGSTSFVGWTSCALMAVALSLSLIVAVALARVLDALTLGEATAQSLGMPLRQARLLLVAAMSLTTAAAVAQMGLIAFVGLAAPHAVRSLVRCKHSGVLLLSTLMGGALLLLADVLARGLLAPQDLPVGVLTAVLGGVYLLWRMKPASEGRS